MLKRLIPNLFTVLNLLCGSVGVVLACNEQLLWSAVLICVAAVFDFMDGFCARMLKVQSPVGKELDSLADMVTFGLLPGIILFQLTSIGFGVYFEDFFHRSNSILFWSGLAFLVPVFSALRLAKFNLDERQSHTFFGLPTPANAVLIASFPMILDYQFGLNMYHPVQGVQLAEVARLNRWDVLEVFTVSTLFNPWFYVAVSVIMSFLLVSPFKFFSFKFKSLVWSENQVRYLFIGIVVVAAIVVVLPYFRIPGLYYTSLDFIIIPILLLLYLILSLFNKLFNITDEVQS